MNEKQLKEKMKRVGEEFRADFPEIPISGACLDLAEACLEEKDISSFLRKHKPELKSREEKARWLADFI